MPNIAKESTLVPEMSGVREELSVQKTQNTMYSEKLHQALSSLTVMPISVTIYMTECTIEKCKCQLTDNTVSVGVFQTHLPMCYKKVHNFSRPVRAHLIYSIVELVLV